MIHGIIICKCKKGYMKIRVTGNINHALRKQVRHAVFFYGKKLMPNHILDELHLHIKYTKLKHIDGICEDVDDYDPARYFKISLTPRRDKVELFSTLAHEMVHVRQMAKNILMSHQTNHDVMIWKRKHYVESEFENTELPWEVEAYGLENVLFNDYVDTHNLKDYFYR